MWDLHFLVIILILLVASRLAGELLERIGQPAMVGEIAVGIILGPSILMGIDPNVEWLKVLANLGLFFMVFLAGVEMQFGGIRRNFNQGIVIAMSSFFISFSSGLALGLSFGYGFTTSIIIGIVFSLSALPVSIRILMDLNKLETKVGRLTIVSAIIDDIMAMIFLSLVIALAKATSSGQELSLAGVGMNIFAVFVFLTIIYIIERLLSMKFGKPSLYIKHYIRKFHSKEAQFAVILIFGLVVGAVGEIIGITFIIGAFYAGLLIDKDTIGEVAYEKTHTVLSNISSGFMAPLFFAYIGLLFNMQLIVNFSEPFMRNIIALGILTILVIIAIASKFFGSYLGARSTGVSRIESAGIGAGLNARGLMGIVIAMVAYQNGFISQYIFSMLVAMSIITTLMAPFLLKRLMKDIRPDDNGKKKAFKSW